MFGRTWVNRHRRFVRALGQKGRGHAFSHAPAAFVLHHIDNQVHAIGKNFQTRRDGIKPRLQFRQQSDEFVRRKFCRWMIEQEIDHFRTPEIIFQIVFAVEAGSQG